MNKYPALLLALCFIGSHGIAAQEDPAEKKRQADLKRERQALRQNLTLAAQNISKSVGENVIACTRLRPSSEKSNEPEKLDSVMTALYEVFLREGLLVYALEEERPLDVAYKAGKLPGGLLLSPEDLKYVQGKKKNKYVLQPQFSATETTFTVSLALFDLEKGSIPFNTRVAAIPIKSFGLGDVCSLEALPFLNRKILMLAAANFGKQVGSGECYDLPAQAISDNGGSLRGYEFGTNTKWEDGLPGDVVTFGTSGDTGGHVLVLYKWDKVRAKARMLHQNWNRNRFVGFGNLGDTEENKKGQEFALWRPTSGD